MSKYREGDRVTLVNLQTPEGGFYNDFGDGSNVVGNVGVVVKVSDDGWFLVLWDGITPYNSYKEHNLTHSYMENV